VISLPRCPSTSNSAAGVRFGRSEKCKAFGPRQNSVFVLEVVRSKGRDLKRPNEPAAAFRILMLGSLTSKVVMEVVYYCT